MMAIYSRWGNSLTIQVNCGQHQPKGFVTPATLVKVRYDEDGAIGFHFAEFLKADDPTEIAEQVESATKANLSHITLREAIKEAL